MGRVDSSSGTSGLSEWSPGGLSKWGWSGLKSGVGVDCSSRVYIRVEGVETVCGVHATHGQSTSISGEWKDSPDVECTDCPGHCRFQVKCSSVEKDGLRDV